VRAGTCIFYASAREDVFTPKGALCVAVLAGLRGADLEDLAGFRLEDRKAAFAKGGGLDGGCESGIGVTGCFGGVLVFFEGE